MRAKNFFFLIFGILLLSFTADSLSNQRAKKSLLGNLYPIDATNCHINSSSEVTGFLKKSKIILVSSKKKKKVLVLSPKQLSLVVQKELFS